ncbi:MAG: phospho-N-acetylmuramoyl-pentapeptide-transferase [Anaerolineae bacterium]|nr:phospho-N-acetylmuramoyl-pentapeptide-transferase [Anaerolineae bacterium]
MRAALLFGGISFLLLVPWGDAVIQALLRRGAGKRIRLDGPASHQVKAGTATMGGLYFLAGIVLATLVIWVCWGYMRPFLVLLAMLCYGALGAFDDLQGLRDRTGVGWLARAKFPAQWGVALALALIFYWSTEQHLLVFPWSNQVMELGWWFVPLAMLLFVATANAVNLTDGLDGLAGGASVIAFVAYGVLAAQVKAQGLALWSFAVAGTLLAFLWFNVHPARVFMGDTGSEALGAGLAGIALLSGHWPLLPLIGIVFVAEALSVILQVGYFKFTRHRYGRGRRILLMAPLHHHFELKGWAEEQVTARLWIVAAVAALIGVALGMK